uniref:SWIM-type domain-containing protein n=1 Tax=Ixodes ricinus TaxID=34613 RepID=V5GI04_IXORI
MKIVSLCLQTSGLQAHPHVITVKFDNVCGDIKIVESECSCKAGMSEKCKHTSATLIHCYRTGLGSLEDLSCTDIECQWTSKKKSVQQMYDTVPLSEFCHIKVASSITVSADQQASMGQLLRRAASDCAIERHRKRLRTLNANGCSQDTSRGPASTVPIMTLLHREVAVLQTKTSDEVIHHLCRVYGSDEVLRNIEESTRSQASSPAWHSYRKGLVTASIARTCMTKAKTFLRSKTPASVSPFLSLILRTNTITTAAMRAGIEKEPKAKLEYLKLLESEGHRAVIRNVGLMLLKEFPLIGCSPDGVCTFSCECCLGKVVLLEVKCPEKLENSFSNFKDRELKPLYATQVNVQMGVCGISISHFFVYVSEVSHCLCEVQFDATEFEMFKEPIVEIYKVQIIDELLHRVGL